MGPTQENVDQWYSEQSFPYDQLESNAHEHTDSRGFVHKCWHVCIHETPKLLTNWRFWAGMTLGFPVEHWIWEKAPIFSDITRWMGL